MNPEQLEIARLKREVIKLKAERDILKKPRPTSRRNRREVRLYREAPRSNRSRSNEELGAKVRASFITSDRTYGARRVWHDMLAEGISCGLHRIERLLRRQALKARPRRRRLPPDLGERQVAAVAANMLNRTFEAPAPNRRWIADFSYVWTAEGWLYVAAVIDLFSRRVVGWSMSAVMTAQLVTDAPVMAIWRRGKFALS
jgi:putative transposase